MDKLLEVKKSLTRAFKINPSLSKKRTTHQASDITNQGIEDYDPDVTTGVTTRSPEVLNANRLETRRQVSDTNRQDDSQGVSRRHDAGASGVHEGLNADWSHNRNGVEPHCWNAPPSCFCNEENENSGV